jgi:hypothetical protein
VNRSRGGSGIRAQEESRDNLGKGAGPSTLITEILAGGKAFITHSLLAEYPACYIAVLMKDGVNGCDYYKHKLLSSMWTANLLFL